MSEIQFPPLYVAADTASGWGQRWHRRIIAANLAFIFFGSILGYVAGLGGEALRIASATVSAAIMLAGVLIKRLHKKLRDDQNWFEGRAIAETVKSLAWRYMMRIPPFDDDARADAEFTRALIDISKEGLGKAYVAQAPSANQITDSMRAVRALDLPARRALYAKQRLHDQVAWYRAKSEFNKERARIWSKFSSAAQTVAIISALAVIITPNVWVNVVGVFGALAAAATAWSQLGRHSELTKSYALAAQELATFETMTTNAQTTAELVEAVRNGEGAVSREHTLWIAKRGDPHESVVRRNVISERDEPMEHAVTV